ncbi:FAD-dependent oxidoreductase [Pseudomaricurvus alkylphenolicus]|uniref:FAD-dependent oxidoreductase n=1 Tax=Pseudomaricurvus alkylphenolicus TaxID=1306991 RepID=UPI0014223B8B|nr:FAD-dependent oxidoreductase [Pseudomaricurvus alkylphenolicus]NIB43516.1 FAD-dependent oxidoreductase [Pseudomaricurvus alkylphenolicus]
MKSHVKAVVVGGGIFGVSSLYHLAKEGWDDIALIEKGELTSGTTWHAAGLCPLFTGNESFAHLHHYGVKLYQSLEEETGVPTGWHGCGGIRLARDENELNWHKYFADVANRVGYEMRILTPEQIKELNPHVELHGCVGGSYSPDEGHVDPNMATNSLAAGARKLGAEIYRNTFVKGFEQLSSGEWKVMTDKGDITCEHLVLATGFFSKQVGRWLDLDVPFVNVVHQYLVTEASPVTDLSEKELPVLRDPASCSYVRQEQKGLLGGPYEPDSLQTIYDDKDVEWTFDFDLLEPDLERVEPWLEKMVERFPAFGEVGIKKVISGFIAHTPDLSPIVGPAPDHKNLWLAGGSAIGISQGPGCGKYLAQWMVHGSVERCANFLDPRRFGSIYDSEWVRERTVEVTCDMYNQHPPGYTYKSGRPLIKTDIYDNQKNKGAVFEDVLGWERPKWFSRDGEGEKPSWSKNNSFESVKQECLAVRNSAGLTDLSAFSKYMVSGEDASDWLNGIFANRMPEKIGGMCLAHMLTDDGYFLAEMTITKLEDNRFILIGPSSARYRDLDLLSKSARHHDGVEVTDVTTSYGCLALCGPNSRQILSQITNHPLDNASFPWLSSRNITIKGVQVIALRVSYAGELGWELHIPIEGMGAVYDALYEAGGDLGLLDFGTYALNSLRMEKGYWAYGTELTVEMTPLEAGVNRFIDLNKPDFVGKRALEERKAKGVEQKLVYMEIDVEHLDVIGGESIYQDGEVIGVITSGAYAHYSKKTLAFGYVQVNEYKSDQPIQVRMLGDNFSASILTGPVYDPSNTKLKS